MNAKELVEKLTTKGFTLQVHKRNRLWVKPKHRLTKQLSQEIRQHKWDIIALSHYVPISVIAERRMRDNPKLRDYLEKNVPRIMKQTGYSEANAIACVLLNFKEGGE